MQEGTSVSKSQSFRFSQGFAPQLVESRPGTAVPVTARPVPLPPTPTPGVVVTDWAVLEPETSTESATPDTLPLTPPPKDCPPKSEIEPAFDLVNWTPTFPPTPKTP